MIRLLLLVTVLVLGGCTAAPPAEPAAAAVAPAVRPLPEGPAAYPVTLDIPAIGVAEKTLVSLGMGPAAELQAPTDYARAGWFAGGPVPGDPGPAVIAGHVDSKAGPAVFYRLRELAVGDPVRVGRSDGTTAEFVVDAVQQYPKDQFPTQAVYGPVPGSALRLVTCGGTFDRARHSYRDNIVVYASRHD